MKALFLSFLQSKYFHSFWLTINHLSVVALNFYRGSAPVNLSQEIRILEYIASKKNLQYSLSLFDCGANKGAYTDLFLTVFPESSNCILAEPTSSLYKNLCNKYSKNKSIIVLNHAISSDKGSKQFLVHKNADQLNSLDYNPSSSLSPADSSVVTVTSETIDSILNKYNFDSLLLLKIDVEGHEPKVLEGARNSILNRKIQFIQVEYSRVSLSSMSFESLFCQYSPYYKFYQLCSDGLAAVRYINPAYESIDCAIFLLELR